MFMKDNGKKGIAAILLSRKKEGPEGCEMEEEIKKAPMTEEGAQADYSTGLKTAAEEIISAVDSKDSKQLVDSLKALITMIKDEDEDKERANS